MLINEFKISVDYSTLYEDENVINNHYRIRKNNFSLAEKTAEEGIVPGKGFVIRGIVGRKEKIGATISGEHGKGLTFLRHEERSIYCRGDGAVEEERVAPTIFRGVMAYAFDRNNPGIPLRTQVMETKRNSNLILCL